MRKHKTFSITIKSAVLIGDTNSMFTMVYYHFVHKFHSLYVDVFKPLDHAALDPYRDPFLFHSTFILQGSRAFSKFHITRIIFQLSNVKVGQLQNAVKLYKMYYRIFYFLSLFLCLK